MTTNTLTSGQKTPTNIDIDLKQREVRITWADDHNIGIYSFEFLRRKTP